VISFLAAGEKQENPPNVLFIVADDLGWNDVSWHNPNIHSPAMEELAADGVLLDQYYVQPTCSPSRVAFMTGRYPYRVGRQHMYIKPLMPAGLAANVAIMPQFFQKAGYTTHAIGKWHLGFCHQNYTPTYRGFDTFYGFYLGSQDFYTHTKRQDANSRLGYDFRVNENILKGPEVEGKYSTDLFVNRAKAIFEEHKRKDAQGERKPWFTYLSFQSVHEPLQVPHSYKGNVCRYKDQPRYFYSAMVSSLDHAMDRVVKSLKETGYYDNTIIVFTTDNGGAVKVGGNNMPLRGTKGTLYEGGTRAIGFVHSPLLQKTGYTNHNLMHAVDWVPTLMSAIGHDTTDSAGLDGVNQWQAISNPSMPAPRDEIVYNIKEKPFMAAIRIGDYKLIWGSRTEKDIWFQANEEVVNPALCEHVKKTRTQANRTLSSNDPRGMETMDVFSLNVDLDHEYEDDYDNLARMQEIDLEEQGGDDETELAEDLDTVQSVLSLLENESQTRTAKNSREGRGKNNKKGGGKKKGDKKKKGGSGKNKKNIPLPNNYGVIIKTWGKKQLFNLREDPEERRDISADNTEMVEKLKDRAVEHFLQLQPQFTPKDDQKGNPLMWGGYWGPGWCDLHTVQD